ncbi:MAG: exo-alpha-sialidase, partial [Armatimonadetes bacterium]|nr:exo-alpha-sialidase [Armatimonadota bacterium]
SKVGDSGWVDVLKMEMLHGVATERGVWHHARLVVKDSEFRLWVDGRPMSAVHDDTYIQPGLVGFKAWARAGVSSTFQDLRISGKSVRPKPWDATLQPVQNWFLPYPIGRQQRCSGITRAPNGELLMAFSPGGLVRSTDNGQTWSPVEAQGWPGGWIHTMRDGRLITLYGGEDIFMAKSTDNGKTWLEPVKAERGAFTPPDNAPQMKLLPGHEFLELNDGTLLAFQISSVAPDGGEESRKGFSMWEWGIWGGRSAWSIRSTDGGRTWSAPVPLNGPPAIGQKYDVPECGTTMQTKEGKVLFLGRPVYSPWMWESWSDNNGESWGPLTCGPFPCYAATALATSSGALLVSGRMPGLGLYVSHDSGMTWKPYRVDTGGLWAMGQMCEVAPDLVLYVYMDSYSSSLRAQFIRITPDGAEPAFEMLPGTTPLGT